MTEPTPEEKSFEQRMAAGSGGGDWYLSEEDKAANEAYVAAVEAAEAAGTSPPDVSNFSAGGALAPPAVEQAPKGSDFEPQALSQPGPTPGADDPPAPPDVTP